MNTMPSPRLRLVLFLGALLPLILGGCVTVSQNAYQNMLAYDPAPSPVKFDVGASLQTIHNLSPEAERLWRAWGNNDASLANYRNAFATATGRDIIGSGLFGRIDAAGSAVDYGLKIVSTDGKQGDDYVLLINYELTDARANRLINQRTLTVNYGSKALDVRPHDHLPGAMQQIKESIIADLQGHIRQQQQVVAEAEAKRLQDAPLGELLVAADPTVATARARNRAIVAAKTTQLPGLLRETRTDALSALVVTIEQTILDLNHESEVAKDKAQRLLAAGPGAAGTISADDLRDFAISYRERIELLKPIAAAIKEEIVNRNR